MNTTNYNLYLEDDSTTRFLDWRKKMNGTDNSNMVKIDAALGEKANSSVAVNTTLLASACRGSIHAGAHRNRSYGFTEWDYLGGAQCHGRTARNCQRSNAVCYRAGGWQADYRRRW